MLISVKLDESRALELTDLILKKFPYATNNALTRTAQELVEVERGELKTEFQIRKEFILSRVRITKYSRPNELWTRVGIDANVQGGKLLLGFFEEGGEKLPEFGMELAVPITGEVARPTFEQTVRPSVAYKALALERHETSGGSVQYKGLKRTFVIAGVGVFQRFSSKTRGARKAKGQAAAAAGHSTDLALIYTFEPQAPLAARMHFMKTAAEFVSKRFGEIWREEFARELAGRRK
jgi:hypothetical protein